MGGSTRGLKTFVYRVLLFRLVAAAALIAVLFGTMAYLNVRDRIGEQVHAGALARLELIKAEVRRILADEPGALNTAIEQALDKRYRLDSDEKYGRFVYAGIQGPGLKGVIEQTEKALPADVMDHIRQLRQPASTPPNRPLESLRIGGHSYMLLSLTNRSADGEANAYIQGLFKLSTEAEAGIRATTLKTLLYVVGIVALTTLLLYPVIIHLVRRMAGFSEQLLEANLETLQVLGSAIAKKDSDTDAHNYRVTLYSLHLAEDLGLDKAAMRGLIKGAFLHDVGKIGIRDAILLKPGRLDEDEFTVMRGHVEHGLDIIDRSTWLRDAADVVGGHHEKFGGGGYPRRLVGADIPLIARIFAIADVFDALTSQRPYKQPFSLEQSLAILEEGKGGHFDPALLERFGKLAADLHARYAGREDDGLKQELREWTRRYFNAGLDSLSY